MASKQVSALTAASALTGTELFYADDGVADVKVTANQIKTFATAGFSTGLTVGTTTIASGTTGRVLYDNGAVVGEYAISGTGSVAMTTSPTFITPALGTPASGVATNLTGTAAGLTAGNVTTNANLTGDVTSVGNASTLATTQAGAHTWSAQQTFAAGTITTSQPLTITQTWNAGGVTFTGLLFNVVTDSASASASLLFNFQLAGTSKVQSEKNGHFKSIYGSFGLIGAPSVTINVVNNGIVAVDSAFGIGASSTVPDVWITRAAAATIQHGALDAASPVPQTLKFQDVVAGTSNTAGVNATIQAPAGTGTGAGGSLIFQVAPAGSTGSSKNAWATALTIASDKGATFTGSVTVGNGIYGALSTSNTSTLSAVGSFGFYSNNSAGSGFSLQRTGSDGCARISNAADNGFDRLQFGGTTTSFPALKRSTTILQARLADDSGYASFQGRLTTIANAVAETIVPDHTLVLYDAAGTAYRVPCQV